jgi:hypothetical protein
LPMGAVWLPFLFYKTFLKISLGQSAQKIFREP